MSRLTPSVFFCTFFWVSAFFQLSTWAVGQEPQEVWPCVSAQAAAPGTLFSALCGHTLEPYKTGHLVGRPAMQCLEAPQPKYTQNRVDTHKCAVFLQNVISPAPAPAVPAVALDSSLCGPPLPSAFSHVCPGVLFLLSQWLWTISNPANFSTVQWAITTPSLV